MNQRDGSKAVLHKYSQHLNETFFDSTLYNAKQCLFFVLSSLIHMNMNVCSKVPVCSDDIVTLCLCVSLMMVTEH